MVQKSTKKGVHSGNTLKASNTRFSRNYKSQSCVVRHTERPDDAQDHSTIQESFKISGDGVIFSLNKKGRWAIPTILKNQILHADHTGETSNLKLVERHKIKRQADCVGFCATKGHTKEVHSKSTYFNIKSVSENQTPGQRARRRRQRDRRQDEDEEDGNVTVPEPIPEVRYEVFYPSPSTSSITHNPKYIFAETGDDSGQKLAHASNKKRRQRQKLQLKQVRDYLDDVYGEDEWADEQEYTEYRTPPAYHVMTADLLNHNRDIQRTGNHMNRKSKCSTVEENVHKVCTKSNIVYVEKDTRVKREEPTRSPSLNNNAASGIDIESEPVSVILSTDETRSDNLSEKYGQRYMECDCFPRKFIIDISDDVAKHAKNSRIFKMDHVHSIDFSSCLVFVIDADEIIEEMSECVYKVYLNMKLEMHSIKLETLYDYVSTNIDDIITKAKFFIETIPIDAFVYRENKIQSVVKPKIKMATLQSYTKLSAQIIVPAHSFRSLFGKASLNSAKLDLDTTKDLCYICMDSLVASGSDKSIAATALHTCGHWFCDSCWKNHLEGSIRNGARNLRCPEYDCDSVVTSSVLLSLLNITTVDLFIRSVESRSIESDGNMKWCPNPKCGSVLKAPDAIGSFENLVNATCQCGNVTCFTCLQPVHWPASCAHSLSYLAKLKKLGDDEAIPSELVRPLVVNGKKCPHCHQFVQKNGGCFYMSCVCGKDFCWGCLKPWDDHKFNPRLCSQTKSRELTGTQEEYFHHVARNELKKDRSKFYRLALESRMHNHPRIIKSMRTGIPAMVTKVVGIYKKYGATVVADVEDFFKTAYPTNTPLSLKLNDFLVSMVDLTIELHHVMEYTSVLLEYEGVMVKYGNYLRSLIGRMKDLSQSIYVMMRDGPNQDCRRLIHRLWLLRRYSKRTIDTLVSVVIPGTEH